MLGDVNKRIVSQHEIDKKLHLDSSVNIVIINGFIYERMTDNIKHWKRKNDTQLTLMHIARYQELYTRDGYEVVVMFDNYTIMNKK